MDLYEVSFNGFALNNGDFSNVMIHDFDRMPDEAKTISPVSSSNFSLITSKYYVQKQATVTLLTRGCFDKISAKTAMIRKTLQGRSGSLVLDKYVPTISGGVYSYDSWKQLTYTSATLDTVEFETEGINSVVTINFTILTPIGKGDVQTLYSATGVTSDSTVVNLIGADIQGTFDTQYPTYELTFNTVTNSANSSVSVSNEYNTITYTGDINDGDVLRFITSLENMDVTLNGETVNFSGTFPQLPLTGALLSVTDTLTARNVDIEITNTSRYI